MRITRSLLLLAATSVASPSFGQAVPSREPTSTHIFPAGGKRGTVVKAHVGTECMPPGMNLKIFGNGVTAPGILGREVKPRYEPSLRRTPRDADGVGANMSYPREFETTLTIGADAEPDVHFWRVSGGWGGTRLRPFLVGDLPEFIETEPNSQAELAERITLPVVINGQIAGERDQDFFIFAAKAGTVVVVDVMAARIGSPLEPVIAISDVNGKRLECDESRVGNDPVLSFRVPVSGDYRLHIANLGFGGGPAYVYRITITTSVPSKAQEQPTDNHSLKTAMEMTAPATVNARFLKADQEDWYRFNAKKGEAFTIACQPSPRDSAAVPQMVLLDASGTAQTKVSNIETPERGFEIDWKAPADGTYRLRLRDLQHGSRGGPEFAYRLTLRPAQPDFSLRLETDYVNVVQSGRTEIDLLVQRCGGFTGPIDLTATGLPDGVKIEPTRIAENQSRVKLSVIAKDDTRPTDAVVHLQGKAQGQPSLGVRQAAVPSFGWDGDSLHLTVQHKPIFRLTCNEAYQYAHRGSIHPYLMKIERLDGFDGPIVLQLCDRQVQELDGIEIVETIIPPLAKEAKNLIYLPETMHASVQHHSRPYAQAYASFTDKWGQKQTLLAVSQHRCMIRTLPPVVKLRAVTREIAARPGDVVECKLALDRVSTFTEPMEIVMADLPGFKAEKIRIEAGQREAILRVQVGHGVQPLNDQTITFRATGNLASGATVATEATVPVVLVKQAATRPVIDVHMHVWSGDPVRFPFAHPYNAKFVAPKTAATVELLVDEMDKNGISHCVLVQTISHGWDNRYLALCVKSNPKRFRGQGLIDPTDPNVAEKLEFWMTKHGLAGMRFSPIYYKNKDEWLNAKASHELWKKGEELGAVFNFFIASEQLPKLEEMIRQYPKVKVVIDHFAYVDLKAKDPEPETKKLLALARYPNVWLKVSELSLLSPSKKYPYKDTYPLVKKVYDAFGPDRLLWGTGFPGATRAEAGRPSLDEELGLIRTEIPFFTAEDREKILGRNAAKLWGFK